MSAETPADLHADAVAVPFNDLYLQHQSLEPALSETIQRIIRDSAFIRGPDVERFEQGFADLMDAEHCVSCANGTDALYIAMKALGAGPGDEVIVPAMSWISTSETVSQTGAKVVFCDVDPVTHTLDVALAETLITERTVGIIPVHLYGFPADMPALMALAEAKGLWVLEDCAQAHLATIEGQKVGTFGTAATFSFYPGKNLGAMGDAGAITTSDKALGDHMAKFARHGGLRKGEHEIEGINSRLDGLQAAVLNLKLERLARWTARRRDIARAYLDAFADLPFQRPPQREGLDSAWHLFVVCTDERDALKAHLQASGVQTAINYPVALPLLPCYRGSAPQPARFPHAQKLGETCLSLPLFPEMTEAQIARAIAAVAAYFD